MLDMLNSLLFGSVTGILGTVVSVGTDWLRTRQQHRNELEMRQFDLEIAREEAASAAHRIALETDAQVATAEARALEESYRQERSRLSIPGEKGAMVWVDVIRGMLRPGLTIMFVALTGIIYFTLQPAELDLKARIIETVLSLTVTVVIWWFGGRRLDKPVQVRR